MIEEPSNVDLATGPMRHGKDSCLFSYFFLDSPTPETYLRAMRLLASIPTKTPANCRFLVSGGGVTNLQKRIPGVEFTQKKAANAISTINILRFA